MFILIKVSPHKRTQMRVCYLPATIRWKKKNQMDTRLTYITGSNKKLFSSSPLKLFTFASLSSTVLSDIVINYPVPLDKHFPFLNHA